MGERSVIVARPTGRGRGSVDVLIDPRVLTYLFDESGLGPGGFLAFATDDGEPLTALGDGAGLATQDRIVTPAAGRLRAEAAVFDGVRVVAESDRGWAAGTAWADLLAVGPPVWGLTTALVWAILTRRRSGMGNDLLLGLRRGEFAVVYQPVVDLRRGNWAGLEAFLRWTHPDYGPVPPAVFIPVAERTGVIGPLSLWLVERAAADLAPLFSRRPDLYLGVNLPPAQLLDGTGDGVLTRAAAAGLPAPRLVIELTERDLPDGSLDELGRAAARLADRGARLALDDFGTGYANYATLSQVRFHLLKLDRSLTAARPGEPGDAILDAMLAMANRLGLAVVAEGLETAERAEHLRAKGVPFGQGWAFGRPVPADKLEG
jgi:EAL domain-containing protein (putative c-di-GMP-specific phosphodiesterase class I)